MFTTPTSIVLRYYFKSNIFGYAVQKKEAEKHFFVKRNFLSYVDGGAFMILNISTVDFKRVAGSAEWEYPRKRVWGFFK